MFTTKSDVLAAGLLMLAITTTAQQGPPLLRYLGGSILTNPITVYPIFYGDFSSSSGASMKTAITNLITDVAYTQWWDMLTSTYKDANSKYVTNSVTLGQSAQLTTVDFTGYFQQAAITNAINLGLPLDITGIYALFFSADTTQADSPGIGGTHSFVDVTTSKGSGKVLFIYLPINSFYHAAGQLPNCENDGFKMGLPSSGGAVGSSGLSAPLRGPQGCLESAVVNQLALKLASTATDPYGTGWFTVSGWEIGDVCSGQFGVTPITPTQNVYTNVAAVNGFGRSYLLQNLWKNYYQTSDTDAQFGGSCVGGLSLPVYTYTAIHTQTINAVATVTTTVCSGNSVGASSVKDICMDRVVSPGPDPYTNLFGGYEGMGASGATSFVSNGTELQLRVKSLPAFWVSALNGSGSSFDISQFSYLAFNVIVPTHTSTFSAGFSYNNIGSTGTKNTSGDTYLEVSDFMYYVSPLEYQVYIPINKMTTDATKLAVAREIVFADFNEVDKYIVWNVRLSCAIEFASVSKRDIIAPEPAFTPPPEPVPVFANDAIVQMMDKNIFLHGRAVVANAITKTVWVTSTYNAAGATQTVTVTQACSTPAPQQLVSSGLCVGRKVDPNPQSSSVNLLGGTETAGPTATTNINNGALNIAFNQVNGWWVTSLQPGGKSLDISTLSVLSMLVTIPSSSATFSIGFTYNNIGGTGYDKNTTAGASTFIDIAPHLTATGAGTATFSVKLPISSFTNNVAKLQNAKEIAIVANKAVGTIVIPPRLFSVNWGAMESNSPRNSGVETRASRDSRASQSKTLSNAQINNVKSTSSSSTRLEEEDDSAYGILDSIVKRAAELSERERSQDTTLPNNTTTAAPATEENGVAAASPTSTTAQDDPISVEGLDNAIAYLVADGSDSHLLRLADVFNKLRDAYLQSKTSEDKLVSKCKELVSEISTTASKVSKAVALCQKDRTTITVLQKEIQTAWGVVESSRIKEAQDQETIAGLKEELEAVSGNAASGTVPRRRKTTLSSAGADEDTIKLLTAEKEQLAKDLSDANLRADTLQSELDDAQSRMEGMNNDRLTLDIEYGELREMLSSKKSELEREVRNKEKLETSVKTAAEQLAKKETEITHKTNEARLLKESITRLETTSKDERSRAERAEKDKEHLHTRVARLQHEYEEQVNTTQKLLADNQRYETELSKWDLEAARFRDEARNVSRMRDQLTKRIKQLEAAKLDIEIERDQYKTISLDRGHESEAFRKEIDDLRKQVDGLSRDRDVAQKSLVKAAGSAQRQISLVRVSERERRNLEHEIAGHKEEATKARKLIWALERDRDSRAGEASRIAEALQTREEEVKIKEMLIFDGRKRMDDLERKLKEQQSLYENVRTDRNHYSKNLMECQDEITEMKRKIKIMNHQIEQLKEEIATKESAHVKQNFEHTKLEKEKESLSLTIGKLQTQYDDATKQLQNQRAEEARLKHVIDDADAQAARLRKEHEAILQERDLLGTQLIRRNEEMDLLYEKIKLLTSTLASGESAYRERLEDIRVLKLEVRRLRREGVVLKSEAANLDVLRNEIFKIQREVLKERTRVKVLEEELESPMNIHRWRKLAGSDPSTFELITKIHALQKRLICKTEEVVEKELAVQQAQRLYNEVKLSLQRQPGPEIIEELRIVRSALKGKVAEAKSLASELNMYHSQSNEAGFTIEKLGQELQELKRKYYEEKRKEQAAKNRDTPEILANKRLNSRIAGAGFFFGSKLEEVKSPGKQEILTVNAA
ncbi:hypothetical protein SmJEL517_g00778 [Synchytrium microbalum]|uniref:Cilia- and flagella-associated protein 58 central coiled coil domain-containing protein n=1 Tax=Synchytrium microbalum TaxID=1806994 RepID=A0A507C9A2_9FUNG|nr:uncharacterized protein SmJEL517_g00778 [Synchytrium microbalum]TPX37647.1 hypothetical protein SmJEL517_g00778 [Synchytrium microbalum]